MTRTVAATMEQRGERSNVPILHSDSQYSSLDTEKPDPTYTD
jgi:hypothetical protein